MFRDPSFTAFAPAKRSTPEELERSLGVLKANRGMTQLLQSMPDLVMLLDANRQVVFANAAAEIALGTEVIGKRPGEALSCQHATETAAGCGTSPSCRHCGAVKAIMGSQEGTAQMEDCRITVLRAGQHEALDLRMWANPVVIDGTPFTLLSSRDIADEKRKSFLERIFLHDLMNTATALRGASALMDGGEAGVNGEAAQRIGSLSSRIIEEINSQRQLIAAETNELVARPQELRSVELLRSVASASAGCELVEGKVLRLAEGSDDVAFQSDPSLLRRVVGNMTKNALEASQPGQAITLGCRLDEGKVAFWVNNPSVMTEQVRLQVFNRSFSTKGAGRGLGTYSMKYLTEKYLEGAISFTSTRGEGTTFVVRYPLAMKTAVAVVKTAASPAPSRDGRLPTVVVADDEPVMRKVLTSFLERAGVRVLAQARNGVEAVAACRQHQPDVLLIDANMPVMSGEEALLALRGEVPSMMSFLLTGEVDAGAIERALSAGASGHLPKDLPMPKIVASMVEQWQARAANPS